MKQFKSSLAIIILLVLLIAASSCKKDTDPVNPQPSTGQMNVKFNYTFGQTAESFVLGKTYVHPITGDTLTFTLLRFYVSNIKLKKTDGTWWVQPESYFLLDASIAGGSTMNVTGIPVGTYTAMEYTMGVDSARNVSGANTGALSLTNGMYWDWNSGYIMFKAEGNSPQAENGGFAYHLGGYSGQYNVVTTKTADFSNISLAVDPTNVKMINLTANIAKLWHSSPSVRVTPTIHSAGPEAIKVANDFYSSISFSGIE
jgi:hypothetical protein